MFFFFAFVVCTIKTGQNERIRLAAKTD